MELRGTASVDKFLVTTKLGALTMKERNFNLTSVSLP